MKVRALMVAVFAVAWLIGVLTVGNLLLSFRPIARVFIGDAFIVYYGIIQFYIIVGLCTVFVVYWVYQDAKRIDSFFFEDIGALNYALATLEKRIEELERSQKRAPTFFRDQRSSRREKNDSNNQEANP
jgi:hypothetical protein